MSSVVTAPRQFGKSLVQSIWDKMEGARTIGYGDTVTIGNQQLIVDEASKIDQKVFSTLRRKAELVAQLAPPRPTVKPEQVACRYCGSEPGKKCTKLRSAKYNRKIQVNRGPHNDRRHDAKLCTQAARAMLHR